MEQNLYLEKNSNYTVIESGLHNGYVPHPITKLILCYYRCPSVTRSNASWILDRNHDVGFTSI